MNLLKIEKFVQEQLESTLSVPAMWISGFAKVLPQAAIDALGVEGINVMAIAEAARRGVAYTATIDVVESGLAKRIVLSLPGRKPAG